MFQGCDSGFGHEVARRLDSIGVKVFAGCLSPLSSGALQLKRISSNNLQILKLDITTEEDVRNALNQVISSLGTKGNLMIYRRIYNNDLHLIFD